MDKGNYKNNKDSEYLEGKGPEPLTEKDFSLDHHIDPSYCDVPHPSFNDGLITTTTFNSDGIYSNGFSVWSVDGISGSLAVQPKAPSLTSLLEAKPTDEDYENILDKLIELFQLTYNEYKFYLAKSSDETKAPNFLQVESPSTEYPYLHKQIFRLAVDKNMDMHELQARFAKKTAEGKVVDLGDNVVIITKDNTPQLPTGVSPIQNGLEGSVITFIISFMRAEHFEEWHKNTFPEDAKYGE